MFSDVGKCKEKLTDFTNVVSVSAPIRKVEWDDKWVIDLRENKDEEKEEKEEREKGRMDGGDEEQWKVTANDLSNIKGDVEQKEDLLCGTNVIHTIDFPVDRLLRQAS